MPTEVTLSTNGQTETIVVKKATLTDENTRLEGLDPSMYPAKMQSQIQFFSKNLTAIIPRDGGISVESVRPTDQPVPEPDVTF